MNNVSSLREPCRACAIVEKAVRFRSDLRQTVLQAMRLEAQLCNDCRAHLEVLGLTENTLEAFNRLAELNQEEKDPARLVSKAHAILRELAIDSHDGVGVVAEAV
jgi:hypothetical protein